MLIERIKEELTLEAVLSHFGASPPAWRTRPFSIPCFLPGHDDRNPSLTIYPQDGRAWCYGCNRGGDVLDITAIMLSTDIKGAVEYWASRLGLDNHISNQERQRLDAIQEERVRISRLKNAARSESLMVERDIPRPYDPDNLEPWDHIYGEKDKIDEKYRQAKDSKSLMQYIRYLWEWRRWALDVLGGEVDRNKLCV